MSEASREDAAHGTCGTLPAPFYADDFATIYHGDCRDILPALTGVGLVFTSPPYNLRTEQVTGGHHSFSRLDSGYEDHPDDLPHPEYVAWQRSVLGLCWDTLTADGAIFYNHKPIARGNTVRLPLELIPEGVPLRQIITWDKTSGICRNPTHYVPSYEWIMVLAREGFRITTRDVSDLWRVPPGRNATDHPAPFPIALASRAINTTSASVVLDPFAGSGTTLRAAKDSGRRAIGIELSERYCEMAAKRLAQEVLDFEGIA